MLERLKDASVKMFLFADASRSRKQTQVLLRPKEQKTVKPGAKKVWPKMKMSTLGNFKKMAILLLTKCFREGFFSHLG